MPPGDDPAGESFRGLVLRLRGRTGLTQRELAARIGVSVSSIQGWEAGDNHPSASSLQALIAAGLQAGGFTSGREREEAQALWAAALRDAPRFRTPFDRAWFDRVAAGRQEPVQGDVRSDDVATTAVRIADGGRGRLSWGEAPDVVDFVGRIGEREVLRQWASDARCRVVAVLGLGGIGKTLLASRVARDLGSAFDSVFWRSLRDAPAPGEWLAEAIGFLAPNDPGPSRGESAQVRRLLELLGQNRCLLVLDNFETVLQPGGRAGEYRPGYERYGTLLRQLAEAPHRSCLVITSREEPPELGPLRGEHGPVRVIALAGLAVEDGRALLNNKRLEGNDAAWQALVGHCGGNGLALKVVGETTREVFGGSIADFLEYATETAGVVVGGVRQLLREQIRRLSELEQELLRRMAVEREPVGIAELAADLGLRTGRAATLEAVAGLRRRSLLERTEPGPLFGLHSVVLEYVTEQLIEEVVQEIATNEPLLLLRQPLLKATAREYVRRSQERLIAEPVLERLLATCRTRSEAERRLLALLSQWRARPPEEQGYGPGTVANLLRLLRGDLKGVDLSNLRLRQVYLREAEAQDASLDGARLVEAVLAEPFDHAVCTALSADGRYLAAGTMNGDVRLWRTADRTLLLAVAGHTGAVWGVALSADGRLTVSSGPDGLVRVWEVATGRCLTVLTGHTAGVRDVALSADGRLVASGGGDGTVRLWEATSGRCLAVLATETAGVVSVALSADGRLVASGGGDGTVRLWETASGRCLAELTGHTAEVWSVALDDDGKLLASGGSDGTVRVWDVPGGRCLAVLESDTAGVRGVALSADGRLLASGGWDGVVRIWDPRGGRALAVLVGHTGGIRDVTLSADGQLAASSGWDRTVRAWDALSGRCVAVFTGQAAGIRDVALSADGMLAASGGGDGAVRLWETPGGRCLAILTGHTSEVWSVALSADGHLVASGGGDRTVRVWESSQGRCLAVLTGHTAAVRSVSLSADGSMMASSGGDGTIRLWQTTNGRCLAVLVGHVAEVWSVSLSADGHLVASGALDGSVRVWAARSGHCLAVLAGHSAGLVGVALSADGHMVASGGADGMVRFWDVPSGRCLAAIAGDPAGARGVALSANGDLVASSGWDPALRVWESPSGRRVAVLEGETAGGRSVALSADGRLMAGAGADGALRLWDVRGHALLRTMRPDRLFERMDITGLAGVTDAQRAALLTLGAVERSGQATPSA